MIAGSRPQPTQKQMNYIRDLCVRNGMRPMAYEELLGMTRQEASSLIASLGGGVHPKEKGRPYYRR